MSISRFLSLPAEIRNRIYGFCTPISVHIEEFEGLLLASQQIRCEYEGEALKIMRQYLDDIKQRWPHPGALSFLYPTSFCGLATVTVQLPLSLYFAQNKDWSKDEAFRETRLEACLAPLYSLHLSKLMFTFYDNDGNFINPSPRIIPTGLLYDLLNPLKPPGERARVDVLKSRTCLQYEGPLNVQELEYHWGSSKVTLSSNSMVAADVETENFFLHESRWFQHPVGSVHNWGRGVDSIWFDLRAPEDAETVKSIVG